MPSNPARAFRLSPVALALLVQLAAREGLTQTAYLEHLIRVTAAQSGITTRGENAAS